MILQEKSAKAIYAVEYYLAIKGTNWVICREVDGPGDLFIQ